MNPGIDRHYDDWDLFALGTLDDQEMRAMAEHLASGCDRCGQESLSAQAFVAGLASLGPDAPLPAGAEMRFRQRLDRETPARAVSREPRLRKPKFSVWVLAPWALAAVCAVVAFATTLNLQRTRHELDRARQTSSQSGDQQKSVQSQPSTDQARIAALQKELDALQAAKAAGDQELRATHDQLVRTQIQARALEVSLRQAQLQVAVFEREKSTRPAFNDRMIALLQSAPLSQLDLKPAPGTGASARVFWKDDSGLLLVARELPPLQPDGSFQLWFFQKGTGKPVNVGEVQVDRTGGGLLFVPPGPALHAMAGALLTAEPASAIAAIPGKEILRVGP